MRLLSLIFAIGISIVGVGCKRVDVDARYRSGREHAANCQKQISMTPQIISQLRTYGVTEKSFLKLEFFFYTNNNQNAASLADELTELGYDVRVAPSAASKAELAITGWTTEMQIDEQTVLGWTASMCDRGQNHDCEFDGWGTNPHQVADP